MLCVCCNCSGDESQESSLRIYYIRHRKILFMFRLETEIYSLTITFLNLHQDFLTFHNTTGSIGCVMYLLKAKKRVTQETSPTDHERVLPASNERYRNRQPQIDTNGKLPGIIKHCKVCKRNTHYIYRYTLYINTSLKIRLK